MFNCTTISRNIDIDDPAPNPFPVALMTLNHAQNNAAIVALWTMAEQCSIDFSELLHDKEFVARIRNFHNSVDRIGTVLSEVLDAGLVDNLSVNELVKHDLFFTYALNSLFWLYLRTQGVDPTKHVVKSEIDRVRTYNARAKEVNDRKTMPRIDINAARRFIRSSLWQPNQEEEGSKSNSNTPVNED